MNKEQILSGLQQVQEALQSLTSMNETIDRNGAFYSGEDVRRRKEKASKALTQLPAIVAAVEAWGKVNEVLTPLNIDSLVAEVEALPFSNKPTSELLKEAIALIRQWAETTPQKG